MEPATWELPFITKVKYGIGAFAILTAFILYILGVTYPAIQVKATSPPLLSTHQTTQDFSVVDILRLLWLQAAYIPFCCTLLFSFLIPVCKFLVITSMLVLATFGCNLPCSRWLPYRVLTVLRTICKYQLVDAFSALLIVTFLNFVGIEADPLAATYAYLCYCLLSIISTQWLCHSFAERSSFIRSPLCASKAISLSYPLLEAETDVEIKVRSLWDIEELPCASAYGSESEGGSADRTQINCSSRRLQHEHSMNVEELTFEQWSNLRIRNIKCYASMVGESQEYSNLRLVYLAETREVAEHKSQVSGYHVSLPDHLECSESGQGPCRQRRQRQYGWGRQRRFVTAFLRTVTAFAARIGKRIGSFLCSTLGGLFQRNSLRQTQRSQGTDGSFSSRLVGNSNVHGKAANVMASELRFLLLVLTLAMFSVCLWVSWERPIIIVSLVPGKQRDFAIDSWPCSFGDVVRRLYFQRHIFSGCVPLVVFPVITTILLYISCICTMMGVWILEKRHRGVARRESSLDRISTAATAMAKHGSLISAFLADLAMADVLALGLGTAFFIVNNVDFLSARIPTLDAEEHNGIWSILSGFGAAMAMGISASQVNSLQLSREAVVDRLEAFSQIRAHRSRGFYCAQLQSGVSARRYAEVSSPVFQSSGVPAPALAFSDSKIGSPRFAVGANCNLERNCSYDKHEGHSSFPEHQGNCSYAKRRVLLFNGGMRLLAAALLLHPCWLGSVDILSIDIEQVNSQVHSIMEYASPAIHRVLPASVGDCLSVDHHAPQPCLGNAPLDVVKTGIYEAEARWISGLKTIQDLAATVGAEQPQNITWSLSGVFKQAAISLRVSECIVVNEGVLLEQWKTRKFDDVDCSVVWDGTDACCKEPIEFSIALQAECHERFPYIRNAELLPVNITSIIIEEKILGIFPVTIADVTEVVKDRITQMLRSYIDPENRWIHWTQGQNFSLLGFLNRMIYINAPLGIACPKAKQ